MSQTKVVTRFAPSPTGLLHVGGARTALFNWAYAKGHAGTFLLRLEDTDQKRSSEEAAQKIIEDLRWLGLDWDNPVIPRQSQRLTCYNTVIDELKARGLAYDDQGAVRFRMDSDIAFDDAVYGHIEVGKDQLEDFVIKKADGFPTFHMAVVVDDIDMHVTHVIRGQEHLSNTAKHAALYDALGKPRPVWVHTPSIMNPDGSKMSKRDKAKAAYAAAIALNLPIDELAERLGFVGSGLPAFEAFMDKSIQHVGIAYRIANTLNIHLPEIDVRDFRMSGYLQEVLCNYLVLLGWNPGNDIERFSLDFFKEHFNFDRINKANSKFDRDKLAAFNADKLQNMLLKSFSELLQQHMQLTHLDRLHKLGDGFDLFASMYQARSKTLEDPVVQGKFFFEPPAEYDEKAVKKNLLKNEGEGLCVLAGFKDVLAQLPGWTPEALHAVIEKFTADNQLKNMGVIAQPLRIAVSGTAVTPPIDQTLALLGRDETLTRIDRCVNALT